MASTGAKPREGGKPPSWSTAQPEKAKNFLAWIAGPAVCVHAHIKNPTRCCLKKYIPGVVDCPGCRGISRVDVVYYLPLYRETNDERIVVLFQRRWGEIIEPFRTHEQVRIGKGAKDNDGAWIVKAKGGDMYPVPSRDREEDADISDWLPRLWGYSDSINGHMLRAGGLAPLPGITQAEPTAPAVEKEEPRILDPDEARELSKDILAETFGQMPQGTAKERQQQRNDEYARQVKRESAKQNGKH